MCRTDRRLRGTQLLLLGGRHWYPCPPQKMFGGGHVPPVPDGSPLMLLGYSLQCSRISDLIKPCTQYAYTVAENNTKMSAALRSNSSNDIYTLLMTSIGSSIKDVCYDILIMHNRRLLTPVMLDLVT